MAERVGRREREGTEQKPLPNRSICNSALDGGTRSHCRCWRNKVSKIRKHFLYLRCRARNLNAAASNDIVASATKLNYYFYLCEFRTALIKFTRSAYSPFFASLNLISIQTPRSLGIWYFAVGLCDEIKAILAFRLCTKSIFIRPSAARSDDSWIPSLRVSIVADSDINYKSRNVGGRSSDDCWLLRVSLVRSSRRSRCHCRAPMITFSFDCSAHTRASERRWPRSGRQMRCAATAHRRSGERTVKHGADSGERTETKCLPLQNGSGVALEVYARQPFERASGGERERKTKSSRALCFVCCHSRFLRHFFLLICRFCFWFRVSTFGSSVSPALACETCKFCCHYFRLLRPIRCRLSRLLGEIHRSRARKQPKSATFAFSSPVRRNQCYCSGRCPRTWCECRSEQPCIPSGSPGDSCRMCSC